MYVFSSPGYICRNVVAGSYGYSWLNFEEMSVSFPKQLYHFIVPPSMHDGFDFSVSSQTLVNITFLMMSPEAQNFLNLRKPNLPFFFLVACAFCVISKKKCLTQGHKDIHALF